MKQIWRDILRHQFAPLIENGVLNAYYQGFDGEHHLYRAVNDNIGYSFTIEEFPHICPDTQLNIINEEKAE